MNRLLIVPAGIAVIGVVAVVAVLATRGNDGGADVASTVAGPRVWIDHPPSGSQFRLGQNVTIRWHASAAQGVQQAEVRVNGELVALADDFDHSAQIVTQRHEWTPSAPGEYIIEVKGTGSDGAVGAAGRKRIVVVVGATPPAGTPVAATGAASVPPTAAPATPPGPGETPSAPPPSESTPGASATPVAATPAPTATRTPKPPAPTATPSPTATRTPKPPAPTVTPSPTATPAPDSQPPPAPYVIWPKERIVISPCPAAKVILRWSRPKDPSGIQDYRVILQRRTGPTWTTVLSKAGITTASLDVAGEVHCGDGYRWRVRARDGGGNISAYSEWAEFGMTLP